MIRYLLLTFGAICALQKVALGSSFTQIAQCKHWVSDAALQDCLDQAQAFAAENKDRVEDLEKAAKYIAEFDHGASARVYQVIIEKLGAKSGCEKSGAIGSAYRALRSEDEKEGKAGAMIANSCYSNMAEELKRMLGERQDILYKRLCPILKKNNAIQGLNLKRCAPFN